MKIVLSCEHATNAVPSEFAALFAHPTAMGALRSHEGWDPGARDLASLFAPLAPDGLIGGRITRLLLEMNRSPGNPARWSRFAQSLNADTRSKLHTSYFVPHLDALRAAIRALIAEQGFALHLSVHSFTREFQGRRRAVDIGVLFDPERAWEARACAAWIGALQAAFPAFLIEPNKPYLGTDDGLTTLLRTEFPPEAYQGIELEVCADLIDFFLASATHAHALVASLSSAEN